MSKKAKVIEAVQNVIVSFHDETMEAVRSVEALASNVEEGRKGIMTRLAAMYGRQAIMPAEKGGLSGNALRKEDGYKAEGSRLGITEAGARELYRIIKSINEVRANVWQSYQRAYFGVTPKQSAPKDESEHIKALKVEKATHEQEAKQNREEAKQIGERIKTSEGEDKLRLLEAQATARLNAARAEMLAKQCAARIKEEAESNAGADAYGALHEALRKLGERYKNHKDEETAELAKQVLALL